MMPSAAPTRPRGPRAGSRLALLRRALAIGDGLLVDHRPSVLDVDHEARRAVIAASSTRTQASPVRPRYHVLWRSKSPPSTRSTSIGKPGIEVGRAVVAARALVGLLAAAAHRETQEARSLDVDAEAGGILRERRRGAVERQLRRALLELEDDAVVALVGADPDVDDVGDGATEASSTIGRSQVKAPSVVGGDRLGGGDRRAGAAVASRGGVGGRRRAEAGDAWLERLAEPTGSRRAAGQQGGSDDKR